METGENTRPGIAVGARRIRTENLSRTTEFRYNQNHVAMNVSYVSYVSYVS